MTTRIACNPSFLENLTRKRFTPRKGTVQVETITYRSRHELYVLALQLADAAGYGSEPTRPAVAAVLREMDKTGGLTFRDGAQSLSFTGPDAVLPREHFERTLGAR